MSPHMEEDTAVRFNHLHRDPETWGGAWTLKGTRVPVYIGSHPQT